MCGPAHCTELNLLSRGGSTCRRLCDCTCTSQELWSAAAPVEPVAALWLQVQTIEGMLSSMKERLKNTEHTLAVQLQRSAEQQARSEKVKQHEQVDPADTNGAATTSRRRPPQQ